MQKDAATIMEVFDNVRRVIQAISEYSKAAEHTTGLTGSQLWALKLLTAAPVRVSELARLMSLRPPTVVGILDRLEAKGLLTRTVSKEDRRVVEVVLTEQGRALVAGAPEVAQTLLVKGLAELSEEQFFHVEEGMRLMVGMLDAGHLVPQPLHR
ncbi:MarR family winged helix-turn-helix transcriptional regulator [Trichlorobacter ammonificans]|uniref:Transcriptional regulator, MarR family n=1 Tax=Trichlorobacter ammonificans TaxID=2916410 RepID=A0ABM9D6T7_9BACT|nr:MarR family transcriptional regulator [Trichlorobacter ammonificans]CAH2030911.1 Transcriptional regulator, MarR family [Trichlorobacter ammonificans]